MDESQSKAPSPLRSAGALQKTFPPTPENDFAAYIHMYWDACRTRFEGIEAIAGKWMFRDLIPAMSDYDTRFICRDDMTVEDWCRMSLAGGEAHLSLCERYPCYARNLEHLPGINLTWSELMSETYYYPEYQQWTFYHSTKPARVTEAQQRFAARPWDIKDEYFHLKKFCLYYGRYDRQIDPPVNMGVHAVKYPMHSRIMHYFNPPVMSAVCILEKKNIPGKFDAFELAERHFPGLRCWEFINEILHARYESPEWYEEPRLSELEGELETALGILAERLRKVVTLVPPEAGVDISLWKAALQNAPIDPSLVIFENMKFSRLMKGRLLFYANAPRRFFDATWPMENELRRIGNSFFTVPFRTYWRIRTGENVEDPSTILDRLRGDPLDDREVAAAAEFSRITQLYETGKGMERDTSLAIAAIFDDFYRGLTKIGAAA